MAIQDKFDSAFTDKLLKKTLLTTKPQNLDANVANDNTHELTKSNLVTLSNSFTSLQNAFNKIYAHTLNVRNLHQYDEKRMANISRQNKLETKIAAGGGSPIAATGTGDPLASTAANLDNLSTSVEKLNEKMKKINLSGNGNAMLPMLLGDGIGSNSRSRLGRLGGRALGVAGVGLDVYGRYQEGQSAGQIAAGTGGGLAGAALGAKGGAAAGAAIGAFFFGAGAVPGAAIGGFLGGVGGYFAGSAAGDTAYDAFKGGGGGFGGAGASGEFNTRAAGGGVKAGGTYVIGERGPEVLMLGGLSGKVIANGQRGKQSEAEKNLNTAADKSSRAAAKVIKGQPPGPTSYSSKLSNYLGSLFNSMPNWLNRIKDYLGIGDDGNGVLGEGQYAPVGDLSGVSGDWKNDTEFINAVNEVAQKYNFDANDLLGLMYHESARTMSPTINTNPNAAGLFQFTKNGGGFDIEAVLRMSRAEQVQLADREIFAKYLPRNANAGQLYAAVYLPGIAKNQGFQGILSRAGEDYYESNPSLDNNNDNVIDYNDLARVISERRVEMGLGPSPSLSGGGLLSSPVSSALSLTDRYGDRGGAHLGLDIDGETGDPIMAVLGGTVVAAGDSGGDAGTRVNIRHDNGMESRYFHLSRVNVSEGQRVTRGQLIGEMGSTGRSSGSHLHLELFVNGRRVNPEIYLRGTSTTVVPPNPNAERVSRPPTTGLPPGYTAGVNTAGRTSTPGVYTPNGTFIPNMAQSANDVPGYLVMGAESKRQITEYFRLRSR
jgi:murein DD-endopeptidase MepM/ murein hydrolase activator NlpD